MNIILSRALMAASLLTTLTMPAFAHVSFETAEAKAGTGYKAVLRVPHGCDGEATNTVRVQIPEGFYDAKPMPKAGWTLETANGAYATPYNNHGTEMTEGVREIVWSGGDLPDAWYDEFVFRGSFGPNVQPGKVHFAVTQECANGEEAWTETTDGAKMPAPAVTIVAGAAADEHSHHGAAAEVKAGDLVISAPFTRATLPNAPVGGGFMTITNPTDTADRLVSATSPAAGEVQVHEMAMEGDVMKMRQLPDGLEIPAHGSATLEPGGLHLMFMKLKQTFKEGETVPVTLVFEKAGEVTLDLPVQAFAADSAGHGEHAGH